MNMNYYQNRALYLEGMQRWLKAFELLIQKNPEKARREARRSLIQTGVLNRDGTPKKQIVTDSVLV